MPIRVEGNAIRLLGSCGHDDVELLLAALAEEPDGPIDLSLATHLHGAVLQVLFRSARRMVGEARDPFIRTWLVPILTSHNSV
jgi:hypothetical protein